MNFDRYQNMDMEEFNKMFDVEVPEGADIPMPSETFFDPDSAMVDTSGSDIDRSDTFEFKEEIPLDSFYEIINDLPKDQAIILEFGGDRDDLASVANAMESMDIDPDLKVTILEDRFDLSAQDASHITPEEFIEQRIELYENSEPISIEDRVNDVVLEDLTYQDHIEEYIELKDDYLLGNPNVQLEDLTSKLEEVEASRDFVSIVASGIEGFFDKDFQNISLEVQMDLKEYEENGSLDFERVLELSDYIDVDEPSFEIDNRIETYLEDVNDYSMDFIGLEQERFETQAENDKEYSLEVFEDKLDRSIGSFLERDKVSFDETVLPVAREAIEEGGFSEEDIIAGINESISDYISDQEFVENPGIGASLTDRVVDLIGECALMFDVEQDRFIETAVDTVEASGLSISDRIDDIGLFIEDNSTIRVFDVEILDGQALYDNVVDIDVYNFTKEGSNDVVFTFGDEAFQVNAATFESGAIAGDMGVYDSVELNLRDDPSFYEIAFDHMMDSAVDHLGADIAGVVLDIYENSKDMIENLQGIEVNDPYLFAEAITVVAENGFEELVGMDPVDLESFVKDVSFEIVQDSDRDFDRQSGMVEIDLGQGIIESYDPSDPTSIDPSPYQEDFYLPDEVYQELSMIEEVVEPISMEDQLNFLEDDPVDDDQFFENDFDFGADDFDQSMIDQELNEVYVGEVDKGVDTSDIDDNFVDDDPVGID